MTRPVTITYEFAGVESVERWQTAMQTKEAIEQAFLQTFDSGHRSRIVVKDVKDG